MTMSAFEEKVKRTLGPINAFRDGDKIKGDPETGYVTVARSMGYRADLDSGERWGAFVQRYLPFAELVTCGDEADMLYPTRWRNFWAVFKERSPAGPYVGGVVDVNEQRALLQAQAYIIKARSIVHEHGSPNTLDNLADAFGDLLEGIQDHIDDRLVDKPGSLLEGESVYLNYLNAIDPLSFITSIKLVEHFYSNPVDKALRQIDGSDFQKGNPQ